MFWKFKRRRGVIEDRETLLWSVITVGRKWSVTEKIARHIGRSGLTFYRVMRLCDDDYVTFAITGRIGLGLPPKSRRYRFSDNVDNVARSRHPRVQCKLRVPALDCCRFFSFSNLAVAHTHLLLNCLKILVGSDRREEKKKYTENSEFYNPYTYAYCNTGVTRLIIRIIHNTHDPLRHAEFRLKTFWKRSTMINRF